MASRTRSVASAATSSVTAKRSIANERGWALADPASAVSSAAARSARRIRLASEGNLGHLSLVRAVQLEVRVWLELKEPCNHVRRECLDRGVEITDQRVEVAAAVLDRLLDLVE